MANNLLTGLFSDSNKLKVVDAANSRQVMPDFKTKRVNIRFPSNVMGHTMESGITKVDTRVIRPAQLSVIGYANDASTLLSLASMLSNRNTLYTITSRGLILPNMLLVTEGLAQSPEVISAAPIRLDFKQVFIEGIDSVVFAQAADTSLIDRGIGFLEEAQAGAEDLWADVSQSLSDIVAGS